MQITYELIKSLREERPGIFNWLLDGYNIVREQGGFSFDIDKMKTKERRLFKRRIATVTEILTKVFGEEEMQHLKERGLLDGLPEKLYRQQKFSVAAFNQAKQHPSGIVGWLEEGNRRVQDKGGAEYLASKLASMDEDAREEFMQEISQFMEMIQDDLSQTPAERNEALRKIEEVDKLLKQKLSQKNRI